MATKILGLDALEHIKDYIDGTSSNINYRIDTELKNHISDKIAEATKNIQTDYDTQYTELINRISFVEQNGTVEEVAKLRLKLDALDANAQNKFNALDGISRELNKLTVDYQELYEGVTTGSVFSAGQLNEIINTAMIDSVDINPNAILTPEMYASKLVSLIGNFGQINAANIIGEDIKGHTISSNNTISSTGEPVWTIKDKGDGWLARKNIRWDENGNVTFGEGVQLKFNNISDADEKLNNLLSNYDEAIKNYIKNYIQNATPDVNTEEELIKLLSSSTIPTSVDGDMVMSPNVIAQKLVSLIGTFGTVNASNIVGEDIQGYTLSSPRTKKDSEGNIIYKEGEYEYALDAQGNKIQATDEHNTPLVDAQGKPIYVYAADKDGNKIPVTDTLSEEETAWILRADGTGHLANGNISWNDGGDLTVAGTINGKIGKSSGDSIGPWNTIIDNDATYIGDKTTLADSSNYFGDNGLFKIGGENGIKSETNGVISIGSSDSGMTVKSDGAIEFGSNVKLAWGNVDAPTDLATQSYVQENGFTTDIAEDWIKTANITCENLKVSKVDTTPKSSGDKVTISENTIHVLNDNEQPGVSISNNNVNFNYRPEKLNEECIYEGRNSFINLGNLISAPGGVCTNKGSINSNAVCEIGALDYGATFNLYVATVLTNELPINVNNYSYSTETATQPFVTIYKYNDSTNAWEYYKNIACTSWDKVTMINDTTTTDSSTMYRFAATNIGEIRDRGIYAVGLSIPANGIIFTTKPSGVVQMRVDFRIDTIKRKMSSFVDIGKNGIVINSENGNIYMDNANIVMSMGTSKLMYGIKITPNGMYYCNGDSTWTAWNPSN